MNKLALIITILMTCVCARADNGTLHVSSTNYFKNQGYQAYRIDIQNVDGVDWLVASNGLTTHATKDIPFGLGFGFRNGVYFAKRGIGGGISSLVYIDGNEHFFIAADWRERE